MPHVWKVIDLKVWFQEIDTPLLSHEIYIKFPTKGIDIVSIVSLHKFQLVQYSCMLQSYICKVSFVESNASRVEHPVWVGTLFATTFVSFHGKSRVLSVISPSFDTGDYDAALNVSPVGNCISSCCFGYFKAHLQQTPSIPGSPYMWLPFTSRSHSRLLSWICFMSVARFVMADWPLRASLFWSCFISIDRFVMAEWYDGGNISQSKKNINNFYYQNTRLVKLKLWLKLWAGTIVLRKSLSRTSSLDICLRYLNGDPVSCWGALPVEALPTGQHTSYCTRDNCFWECVALQTGHNFWKEYIIRFLKSPPFKNLKATNTQLSGNYDSKSKPFKKACILTLFHWSNLITTL